MKTIFWHDYETFGSNPRVDRPSQFAGIRTDEALNIVGDPVVMYCQPADDFLPEPMACVVTGIGPGKAKAEGLSEAEFCEGILAEFSVPGTCVAGYNSIRFDDEMTRHMLYRCLHDPYEREYKNGNSRWDIIDMLRLTHALRPQGIQWPAREDGHVSFRLEELTAANGLAHEAAHDALSDVLATIAVARLVREAQPRLYDYCYQHRGKQQVLPMLNPERREPVLHVSGMFGAGKGNIAVVIPLLQDARNRNAVHVYDLSQAPDDWLALPADEIRHRVFSASERLQSEGLSRIALKTIHANRCPVVAPLNVLDEDAQTRWGIDLGRCRAHLERLEATPGLEDRLAEVFSEPALPGTRWDQDPDLMLYSGAFFSPHDRQQMQSLHGLSPEALAKFSPDFQDTRLEEMLFRYRARNFPHTLNATEFQRWEQFRSTRLNAADAPWLDWERFAQAMQAARDAHPGQQAVLDDLQAWADGLRTARFC